MSSLSSANVATYRPFRLCRVALSPSGAGEQPSDRVLRIESARVCDSIPPPRWPVEGLRRKSATKALKEPGKANVSSMRKSARSSARLEGPDPTRSGSWLRRMNRPRAAVQRISSAVDAALCVNPLQHRVRKGLPIMEPETGMVSMAKTPFTWIGNRRLFVERLALTALQWLETNQ